MLPAIAIFDIGKTNKKLFVFDEDYNILLERSGPLVETKDEDGFSCEDLVALNDFVLRSIDEVFSSNEFVIKAVNFSTYGASFVHVDQEGTPLTTLYNYLKPYPESLSAELYRKYGGERQFSLETASPILGSLNSGLQLLRLKEKRP